MINGYDFQKYDKIRSNIYVRIGYILVFPVHVVIDRGGLILSSCCLHFQDSILPTEYDHIGVLEMILVGIKGILGENDITRSTMMGGKKETKKKGRKIRTTRGRIRSSKG